MTADQLLNDLGLTMGLDSLRLDDQGCACLMFDGKTPVNLEFDTAHQVLHLYTVVGDLPATDREVLFLELLQANLFGAQTSGATLAIDSAHNEIVLCRSVTPEQLTGQQFRSVLENFVSCAEEWLLKLSSSAVVQTDASPVHTPLETMPAALFGQFSRA